MIYNVVIHVANEQPLMADLFDLPAATDAGLVCTNVRAPDGKKPLFIEHSESTFFFPYHVVRFLEIPAGELERHRAETGRGGPVATGTGRIDLGEPASRLPVVVADADAGLGGSDDDLEIDEDFLQRIRDI